MAKKIRRRRSDGSGSASRGSSTRDSGSAPRRRQRGADQAAQTSASGKAGSSRSSRRRSKQKNNPSMPMIIGGVVIAVLALGVGGWFLFGPAGSSGDGSETTGQVAGGSANTGSSGGGASGGGASGGGASGGGASGGGASGGGASGGGASGGGASGGGGGHVVASAGGGAVGGGPRSIGDPSGQAKVLFAATFGGPDIVWTEKDKRGRDKEKRVGDEINDIAAGADESLYVCGVIQSESAIPSGTTVHRLLSGSIGRDSGFVAKLSPDGMQMQWFAVLPEKVLALTHLAVDQAGNVYAGGRFGEQVNQLPNVGNVSGRKVALVRISADGSRIDWARGGAPNQSKLWDIVMGPDGHVYWTGDPSGRGQANYVCRLNPRTGEGVNFPKGELKDGKWQECWTIYLHDSQESLRQKGEYFDYYRKCYQSKDGYDYDGPGGWGPVRFSLYGLRLGGPLTFLPNGDMIVTASLGYDFRVKGKKGFPAFDLFIARYKQDGQLVWSSNLYRPNDSVHTPDQKPWAITYDAATDTIIPVVGQHGSNVYRFWSPHADLKGDTGNMYMAWVGAVKAADGVLTNGWYFQTSYNTGYTKTGLPKSPPHPSLSGNHLGGAAVDSAGHIYLCGVGGAKMWTSPNAFRQWPAGKPGGGKAALIVLNRKLVPVYASVFDNSEIDASGQWNNLVITSHGLFMAGEIRDGFTAGAKPSWSKPAAGKDCAVIGLRW